MAWSYNKLDRIFVGDSQTLEAVLMTKDGATLVPEVDIASASFTVIRPSDDPGIVTAVASLWTRITTVATVASVAHGLTAGQLVFVTSTSDALAITAGIKTVATIPDVDTFTIACLNGGGASGTIAYDTKLVDMPGTIAGDGLATFTAPTSFHDTAGNYRAVARFAYTEGGVARTRSIPIEYDCVDPLVRATATPADEAVNRAWDRLEDVFDSDHGGPWLRDMTLARFDVDTLARFIPDVLLEINTQTPQTQFTLDGFPFDMNDGGAIFSTGLFCATVRHLMVSYTEQPDVAGSQVAHFDRRKYQQAWKAIYDIEAPRYERLLGLFKAKSYNLVNASVLVSGRGRNRQIGARTRWSGRNFSW